MPGRNRIPRSWLRRGVRALAVSYTHLDVYKRQVVDYDDGITLGGMELATARQLDSLGRDVRQSSATAEAAAQTAGPVSYTHLDVYKRQAGRKHTRFATGALWKSSRLSSETSGPCLSVTGRFALSCSTLRT